MSETTRRAVLAGAAGIGAATVLAACGEDDTPTATPDAGAGNQAAASLATKADIPVGGGKVFAKEKVVVTQPTAGQFKCFTAICTHAGCTVSSVEGGKINCGCHGSAFKIEDGSVASGPANKPLASKTLKVDGDKLVLG